MIFKKHHLLNEFWHNLTNNIFQHIDYKLAIGSPWTLRFIIIKTCQRFVIMVLNLDEVNWIGCCWNTYIQYLYGFQKCPLRSYLSNCKSPCIVPRKLCIILYPWSAHWIFLNNKLEMDENYFFPQFILIAYNWNLPNSNQVLNDLPKG